MGQAFCLPSRRQPSGDCLDGVRVALEHTATVVTCCTGAVHALYPGGVTPFIPASPQVRMGLTPVPLKLPVVTPSPTVPPTLIPVSEDTALSLLVLHTSDTRGYVAPCG